MAENELITEIQSEVSKLDSLLKDANERNLDVTLSGGTFHNGSATKQYSNLSISIKRIEVLL